MTRRLVDVDDGSVGYDSIRSRFLDLNASATELYRVAEATGTSTESLSSYLQDEHGVAPAEALEIAESFLAQMSEEGWI